MKINLNTTMRVERSIKVDLYGIGHYRPSKKRLLFDAWLNRDNTYDVRVVLESDHSLDRSMLAFRRGLSESDAKEYIRVQALNFKNEA